MKIKQTTKRRMALFLGVLMVLQTALFVGPTGAAEKAGKKEYDIIEKGNPSDAFSSLKVTFDDKVTNTGTMFGFRVDGSLDQGFIQDNFEYFVDYFEGMDLETWEEANGSEAGYDEYLDRVDDDKLPSIEFSFDLKFPETSFTENASFTGDMITPAGLKIGTLELTIDKDKNTGILTGKIDKHVYRYQDIIFGGNMDVDLELIYKENTEVTVTPGEGSEDFIIDIPADNIISNGNSDYEITKDAKVIGKRTIIYTIKAAVKDSKSMLLAASDSEIGEPASDSETGEPASKPETRKAKKLRKAREKKLALAASRAEAGEIDEDFETDRTYDPEDDEDWEDGGDGIFRGPGLFSGLIERMVPDQYGLSATGGELREAANLKGKKIVDQLPKDLEIVSVKIKGVDAELEKAEKKDDLDGTNYYCDENDVLTYLISGNEDEVIRTLELEITTRVSDEKYNAYMMSKYPSGTEWKFSNKAILNGEDDKPLTSSKVADATIKLPAPYQKDGYVIAGSGGQIEWTLDVTSYFSKSGVTLWAIDHIEDVENTHNYIVGENALLVDGQSRNIVPKNGLNDPFEGAEYDFSNVNLVRDIEELLKPDLSNTTDAVVYYYKTGAGTVDAVMLIPLSAETDRAIEIKYKTQANIGMTEEDTGKDGIQLDLKNEVKITWRWPEAIGPGPGEGEGGTDFGGATIVKPLPVVFSLVKKTAGKGAYNPVKNEITWKFEVNQMGVAADNLKIQDNLTKGIQSLVLPKAAAGETLTLANAGGSGGTKTQLEYREFTTLSPDETKWSGDFYTVKTESAEKQILIVFFDSLAANEHYTFEVVTFVDNLGKDGNVGNDTSTEITNQCNVTADVGGTKLDFETEAKCTAVNTLIKKEAVQIGGNSWYNYKDNTVKWRITINPNQWEIRNAVITDTLPKGTHFAELTGAWKGTESGASMNPTYQDTDNPSSTPPYWAEVAPPPGTWTATDEGITVDVKQDSLHDALIFKFKQTDASEPKILTPYTFEFTTYVNKDRRLEFISKTPEKLENKARLTGDIYFDNSKKYAADATGTATNPYCPPPMVKSGKYLTNKQVTIDGNAQTVYAIDWVLYVNRNKVDMSGGTVTDEIQECMELLPDTMKVCTVSLDEAGKETGPGTLVSNPSFGTLNERKFVYQIPEEQKTDTLKFEFTTMLVDDAEQADMTNNVALKSGDREYSTGDVEAEGAARFRLGYYAEAKLTYLVKIFKTSANKTGKYPLQGAEFKIYKMEAPLNPDDRGNIEEWTKGSLLKTKISSKRGAISFLFLNPDTMYKIVETSPPAGYQTIREEDFSWYVVPGVTKDNVYPANPDQTADGVTYTVLVNNAASKSSYLVLNIENKPIGLSENGKLQFKKKGQSGQILAGVEFTARYGNESSGIGETVKSDANGLVSFENLDLLPAGKFYTITEKVPAGYKNTNWSINAEVSLGENGQPSAKFVDENGKLETIGNEKVLKNEPIIQSGSFMKTDQNGDPVLGRTVAFKVERRGDGGGLLGKNPDGTVQLCLDVDGDGRMKSQGADGVIHSADQYYAYLPLANSLLASDTKGVVAFDNLPYGDYRLTEQNSLSDIQLPGSAGNTKVVYLRINEKGAFAGDTAFANADLAFGTVGTKLSETDSSLFKVTNNLQYANLQINKILGKGLGDKLVPSITADGKNIPLSGIKFDVYRDEAGDGTLKPDQTPFIANLVTDAVGHLTFPADAKKLTVGKYILKETDGKGYAMVPKDIPFTVAARNTPAGGTFTPDTVYIGWDGKNYTVTQASGTSGGDSVLFLNGQKGATVIGQKTAEDASGSFGLINAEFQLTPIPPTVSGTLTAKSDASGKFVFNNVPTGTYELKELHTPHDGRYNKDDRTAIVTVTSVDQVIETGKIDAADQPLEFVNEALSTLTIKKLAQTITGNTSTGLEGEMLPGEGFVFKITGSSIKQETLQSFLTNADIEGASATRIEADGVYVTTGASGTVILKNLPAGNYKVQEQQNDRNNENGAYIPDTQEKPAVISIDKSTGKVTAPEILVENRLRRGQIQGLKTIADGKTPLQGAVIGLFPTGTTSFAEANLWHGQKAVSDGEGKYLFQNLPYGTYLVAELSAPSGYNLNSATRYEVTVAAETVKTTGFLLGDDGAKAETESPITIANTKKSSGGGGGGGGGGTQPVTPTTPPPGGESTAPNPGETNPGETLPTIPVETEPGGGTVVIPPNTPPGSDFEVKDPDGNTVLEGKTDENGQIHMELPPGEYTLITLDENQIPLASMNFTIEDGDVPLAQLAAPDAGDHSVSMVLLGVLMLISLSGIIVISRRKKNGSGDSQKR